MEKTNQSQTLLAKAVGRRKEAIAQVQLVAGTGAFMINNKPADLYLQNNSCSILSIKSPFEVLQTLESPLNFDEIDTIVKVQGGGLVGQAEAIKLGVARAVCSFAQKSDLSTDMTDVSVRKSLKTKGLLTVDARVKERRKYGLKKARKAPQYNKR